MIHLTPIWKMLAAAVVAAHAGWTGLLGAELDSLHEKRESSSRTEEARWPAEFNERLDWWSLQPLADPQPPGAPDPAWSREPVDRFVRAALESAGLAPAPAAEPEVLLRRLSFVLTGLPPAPEQRERFLKHSQTNAEEAYERLVDDLLASPHYGERFARHWMDVVRYTDTYGYEWDNPAKGSWEYRDYLIRAFNGDLRFDRFLTEQLAGDLLPEPRLNRELGLNESLIGPMFYHLGEHRHGSSLMFNGIHQDMVNNKIDAFSKAFMAMTVACARCHDHKLEAVSQRDYYALAAVFMTPRWTTRVVDAPGGNDKAIAELKQLRETIRTETAARWQAVLQEEDLWNKALLQEAIGALDPATVKIDDVAYPMARLLKAEGDIEALWTELAEEWRKTRAGRLETNAHFQVLADFRKPELPEGWVMEGDGIRHGYVEEGTPLVGVEGNTVIERLLHQGYHTHALSSKLPGALRMPPQHAVPGRRVSVKLGGGEFGGYLVMDGNAFQNETVKFLNGAEPAWTSFTDAELTNGVTQVTVEFTTASLNPNFPPRTGLAKGLENSDLGYEKRSRVSVTGIVAHDREGTPQDALEHFAPLYDGEAPQSAEEAWRRVSDWLAHAVRRWCDGQAGEGEVRIVNWLLAKELLPNQAEDDSLLAAWLAEYRRVDQSIDHPRTVISMDERETVKVSYPLDVRGNVDVPGELIPAGFLQMFEGRNQVSQSRGSGRLEVAEFLLHPEHPLTWRVYANRVWQWIFGAGLVRTPDDFGHLGGKPSHPELLDYLAREFRREGGSTKKLVRRLVLSRTFRQSGLVREAALERDPDNRLLHHYPTRRLEAEAIRDALLAVSGRLDPTLYGRPIEPPRAAEDSQKRLFSGPLDGDGRRSLYLKMSIMEPPKFLLAFNLPDLRLPTGKRDVSNVPAQALTLLNDPLVHALARHWASKLAGEPHATPEERVQAMFVTALGREPDEAERRRWTAAVQQLGGSVHGKLMQDESAWSELAHAIFNMKEFIYYR